MPTAPAEQSSGPHPHLPTYGIVLIAVVGGLSFIVGLLLLFAICWHRRTRQDSHPDDTDDEITHSGARFRLLRSIPLPRSLRSSTYRHSRVPQADLEAAHHPNDSDWHVVDSAPGSAPPPLPATMRNLAAYGPIVPYQDDDDEATHPATPASHQTQSTTAASSHPSHIVPRTAATTGSGSGSQSTGSLFYNPSRPDPFAHVVRAPGEVLDRDPRVFPDRYSYMAADEAPALVPLAPPPFHSRNRSNTVRTLDDSQRTRVAPLMAYPDSPVSEVDEGAGLLAATAGIMSGHSSPGRVMSGHSSPARSPSPRHRQSPTLVQRLSVLLRRLSGSPSPQPEHTTPFLSQASPEQQQPQMKELGPLPGFGFLSAPPPPQFRHGSSSTRADRPMSTLSGSGQTVYYDAHSRPESPYVDAPPVYGTPVGESDVDLDSPAPRRRYPPGLTPTEAQFRLSGGSAGARRVSVAGGLEELEEEDIVGDLRPVGRNATVGVDEDVFDMQPPEASGAWTQIKDKGKARMEADDERDPRERRATLGEPLQIPAGPLFLKSPASSQFPARSASRSTGSNSHSSRSRRTGSSSISSASLRRLQQSTGSGAHEEPFIVEGEGMPTGRRRRDGSGPLLSATFGPMRSRTPSSHGKSKSRSGSQSQLSHAQSRSGSQSKSGHTHSRAPSPTTSAPGSPNLRSVVSALSLGAHSFGQTTLATTDPGVPSVRHVPARGAKVDEDEPLPLAHMAGASDS